MGRQTLEVENASFDNQNSFSVAIKVRLRLRFNLSLSSNLNFIYTGDTSKNPKKQGIGFSLAEQSPSEGQAQ